MKPVYGIRTRMKSGKLTVMREAGGKIPVLQFLENAKNKTWKISPFQPKIELEDYVDFDYTGFIVPGKDGEAGDWKELLPKKIARKNKDHNFVSLLKEIPLQD